MAVGEDLDLDVAAALDVALVEHGAVSERRGGLAGGSLAADPFGNLIFEAGNAESRHAVELDFDQLAASRAVYDYRRDQRLHVAGERIEHANGLRELLIP